MRCRYLGSLAGKGALVAGTCWALWRLVTRRSGSGGGAAASNWPGTGPAMEGAEVRASTEARNARCTAGLLGLWGHRWRLHAFWRKDHEQSWVCAALAH